ncbi:MAG: glycosyltransferase family 4 protein [Deltaproteobacteria bacterium]|jgi:glycosyltransferase involved in cell wall biosynthesis|nr:glycosyltransferase family 4 protein [Deltaproteobacteria bacterium]
MKVIFVSYYDFRAQSGMHIFHLANALALQGVECAVYSCGDPDTVSRYGRPQFRSYGSLRTSPKHFAAMLDNSKEDSLVHCWTPRESSRVVAGTLAQALKAPLLVHMEDNEEEIFKVNSAEYAPEFLADSANWLPGGELFEYSHPERSKAFISSAQGYTCLIEALLDFKPDFVPGHVFWPACGEPEVFDIPRQSSPEEKARWGIPADHVTLFYPGSLHLANIDEMTQLYCAVALLHRAGMPVRIIKFGNYGLDIPQQVFSAFNAQDCLVDLTDKITHADIPQVMRATDILVQPGENNAFNKYRFPCKLPLFMASGRPVILPVANLGQYLQHGENCLLLKNGGAEEISSLISYLVKNPYQARSIGAKGRAFAAEHFSWEKSASGLYDFYQEILATWRTKET